MATIDTITQAMRDLTPDEIRARLAAIDAEGQLLRQLLRATLQRDKSTRLMDTQPHAEVSHVE